MAEIRLIDANKIKPVHVEYYGKVVDWATIEYAPTIDPEAIPIVRQLREELARVTEERDAAVKDLETAMKIDSEVDDIGLSFFLCRVCSKNDACDGPCEPKWRGTQEEE